MYKWGREDNNKVVNSEEKNIVKLIYNQPDIFSLVNGSTK